MQKKIKVLYYANILSSGYFKSSSRSGIFFAALNILKELMKNKNIEITFYADVANIYSLKNFIKLNPEFSQIKILGKFTYFHYLLGMLEYYKYKCRKLDQKDNILKMGVRFICIRLLRFLNRFKFVYKDVIECIDDYDVFFSPNDASPKFILENKKIKRFTFLHDVIPVALEDYMNNMQQNTTWFKKLLDSVSKEDYYITNSEHTKKDFLKYCSKFVPDSITVALLGANKSFYPVKDEDLIKSVKEKYNIPQDKKFIFSLCTLEPRKNLIFNIKNFIRFIKENDINDLIFVMGGGHWQAFIGKLEKEINNLGIYKNKILHIGYVDDEDLPVLYSASDMFVYTSLYEGFGMPVLEAMQCGCACITSNVTSIPEVVGDAGIQINPKSDEELVEAYKKLYYDEEFKKLCKQKAIERAKRFSWEKCAKIIVDKMNEVIQ